MMLIIAIYYSIWIISKLQKANIDLLRIVSKFQKV